MKRHAAGFWFAALLGWSVLSFSPSAARADVIGPCPEGETIVENPTSPGEMHHGGFHCEPGPSACSVGAPGSERGAGFSLAALGAGVVLVVTLGRRSR